MRPCCERYMTSKSERCDRFTAVTRPISYARQKTSRRVYVMIAAPWIVSLAISSPIALGLNQTARRADTPRLCTFYNSDFLIYSSMGSFYVPTVVMIVLYWRVYLAIRSRRSVSTSSGRGQPMRPADESVSCMASAAPPPSTMEACRGEAVSGVIGDDQASNGDATLSVVAATLSAIHLRSKELTLRVTAASAIEATATVGTPGQPPSPGNSQCRTPLPAIAVIDTDDDIATVSPPTTPSGGSIGTAPPTPADPNPTSVSAVAVDACGVDCTALDSGCTDTMPEIIPGGRSVAETAPKNVTPTLKPSDAEQSDSVTRCPLTRAVRPAALAASSGFSSRRHILLEAGGCGAEASRRLNSDEDDGETVIRMETPSAIAPVVDRANGRFVTFFNFAPKQRSTGMTASTATDRRLKRAVRRERRATKTLAIVLGNLYATRLRRDAQTHSV